MPCRNHPQVEEGLARCYRCGYEFCEDCLVEFQGSPHCAECKAQSVGRLESGDATGGGDEGELPPWERREQLGLMGAFWATIKGAMLDPMRFFGRMDTRVTAWDCLAIPCILSALGAVVGALFQLAFMGAITGFLQSQMGSGGAGGNQLPPGFFGLQMFGGTMGACMGVVIAPVFSIVYAFALSGLMHLYLAMTGNARVGYQQTLRGYCYAQAPGILAVIPVLGGIVGLFWTIWTMVVSVKQIHKTSWGTAWLSVLWWVLLGCLLCGGVYAMIIAAAVAAQQGG